MPTCVRRGRSGLARAAHPVPRPTARRGCVFAWVFRCTRLLLARLRAATPDLEEQLALFAKYMAEPADVGTVRETVDRLWVRRSPHETVKTAVVRLFTALIGYRAGGPNRPPAVFHAGSNAGGAPPADRGQAFEAVIQDFLAFVHMGKA